MLNIKGKMLAHPSQRCVRSLEFASFYPRRLTSSPSSFMVAFSNLRQSMSREIYPHRINHARRFFPLGLNKAPLPSWSVAMGTASFVPINKILLAAKAANSIDEPDESDRPTFFSFFEPAKNRASNGYTDSLTSLAILVWYPVMTYCMSTGDKLPCIALRDTCVALRRCYGLFRNDMTRYVQSIPSLLCINNNRKSG